MVDRDVEGVEISVAVVRLDEIHRFVDQFAVFKNDDSDTAGALAEPVRGFKINDAQAHNCLRSRPASR